MSSTAATPRTLVVGVDGSDQAMLACRVAAGLAAAWGAPLHLVHAWEPYLPATAYGGGGAGVVLTQDTVDVLREGVVALMTQARAVAERRGATATPHLVEGQDAADAILAVAREVDADLIVVGRRGLGAVKRLFLGSVSEALVHRSARPLLLLQGDSSCWPPRTVVAAVDGSDEATCAARLGAAVAAALGATVRLVHAVPRDAGFLRNLDDQAYQAMMVHIAADIRRRGDALHRLTGASVESGVELAAAVPAILAAVTTGPAPVLVAMGTHGRGVASRALLGSVATTVLHDEAVASVLVAPPATRHQR
jgi:nucleotide-binding universal stress UspA family protein